MLDRVWKLYRGLDRYRKRPTPLRKSAMETRFDRIFGTTTGYASLDRLLERLRKNKDELLRVLDHPETPLHTNQVETDVRSHVTRRKISFGTRSEAGRAARDGYLGAVKTCDKLCVSFWDYLRNRLGVAGAPDVPRLDTSSGSALRPDTPQPDTVGMHPEINRSEEPVEANFDLPEVSEHDVDVSNDSRKVASITCNLR